MKLYKLKHIPTGLFYTPSKGYGNLSATGKIYINRIPDIKWTSTVRITFYTDSKSRKNEKISEWLSLKNKTYKVDQRVRTLPEEWEIIELENE